MSSKAPADRPLSPFLMYRFPLTVILSITHRMTGVALVFGAVLLIYVLVALALGPGPFGIMRTLLGSLPGQIILVLWTFALSFHFCNGIRHLFWDLGYGFDVGVVGKTAVIVVIVSVLLTALMWGMFLAAAVS